MVNLTKRQYFDIDGLGENNKLSFVGQGLNGIALGRLLVSHGEHDELWNDWAGNPNYDKIFIGAWAGDRIVVAGDCDQPNPSYYQSSEDSHSDLNLYDLTYQTNYFEDLTTEVLRWLIKDPNLDNLFVERCNWDSSFTKDLRQIQSTEKSNFIKDRIGTILAQQNDLGQTSPNST